MFTGSFFISFFISTLHNANKYMLSVCLMLCLNTLSAYAGIPNFGNIQSADNGDFLKVEQAFKLQHSTKAANTLQLNWIVAEGYSLYQERVKLLSVPEGVTFAPFVFDQTPTIKDDPTFGKVNVFHGQVGATLHILQAAPSVADGILEFKIQYQGCADLGLCYPPVTVPVVMQFKRTMLNATPSLPTSTQPPTSSAASTPPSSSATITANTPPASSTAIPTTEGGLSNLLAEASLIKVVLTMLLLGLGLAFTPCVFPMIPILSGIIAGQKDQLTPRKGFLLSTAYVQGMAVTYAILGVLMGLFGAKANISAWMQQPWIIASFAALFVVLALGMFGLFTLQLPYVIQNKLNKLNSKQQGGNLLGVFLMGVISALVVSPCVSAPLVGVLAYISTTGDALLGGAALYALALGMGVPLMLLGISSGRLLPKAGGWMDTVKQVFGMGLLAVAILLIARIIPSHVVLLLWAVWFMATAVILGLFTTHTTLGQQLLKGGALLLALYASLLVIGFATKAEQVTAPLSHLIAQPSTNSASTTEGLSFQSVNTLDALNTALAQAAATRQPVMVDVSAEWCAACKVMERTTFKDATLVQALKGYALIKFDITESTAEQTAWLQQEGIYGPPALRFYDATGKYLKQKQIMGEASAAHVLQILQAP